MIVTYREIRNGVPVRRYGYVLALLTFVAACAPVQERSAPDQVRPPSAAGGETARVVSVIDGDTIDVEIEGRRERVRYIGINTPERDQPLYREATDANARWVAEREVRLERDVSDRDRFGRLLRYVYVDGVLVNEALLLEGYAQLFTFPPDVRYEARLLDAQREGQREGRGLWAGLPPMTDGIEIVRLDDRAELVEIANRGTVIQSLDGWTLVSERGNQRCPLGGTLEPGQTLAIWARAVDRGRGGYNCDFDENIWSGSAPDPAVLLDDSGREIDRMENGR